MAVKMKKPDYWPALEEGERLAGIQRERDARRRSIINKEDCIRIRGANEHNLKNLTLEIPRNELVDSPQRAGRTDRTFGIGQVFSGF